MSVNRSIVSLLLLSAYALLLFHDVIPHNHNDHLSEIHVTSASEHHHEGHGHFHSHSDEKNQNDDNPSSPESESVLFQLIHEHSHSDFDGHQHNLVYRVASKDKLIPNANVVAYHSENQWRLPDQLFNGAVKYVEFNHLFPSQFRISSHGLRAPPALG